jgi:hypothetical protein
MQDVIPLHPRIALQDRIDCVLGREHAEDVFDGQSVSSDDRLAAENGRIDRQSAQ